MRRSKTTTSIELRPENPFDLIRWLAKSQSDPRKAVAELVQNSLDAGASHVTVTRQRLRGSLCFVIRDDGEGVLPEMERQDALRYLATHVGHSRKLGLDPAERAQRVIAGKYGVGLLGFWAVGRFMELRTRVARSELFALRLEADSPRADIDQLPMPIDAPDTFTELIVRDVLESAARSLGGRRLAEYLAAELRGQLLAHDVELVVIDGVARGLAQKRFDVRPKRFPGEPLALPSEVPVAQWSPMRVELYLSRGADRPALQIGCAGTLVADDISELGALGLAERPWTGCDVTGLIDFPDFSVPPGTRRGVLPDRAAAAFAMAMESLAPLVIAELDRYDAQRQLESARDVVRDLRRALRGLRRRLPQYDLPHVPGGEERVARGSGTSTAREADGGSADAAPSDRIDATDSDATESVLDPVDLAAVDSAPVQPALFPPGPLANVRIVPPEVSIAPGAERRVRAVASDSENRRIDDVNFEWRMASALASVEVRGEGARPAVYAQPSAAIGARAELHVLARQGEQTATAHAHVTVAENPADDTATLGVPEPVLVSDPEGAWRSRRLGERWEVNDAHDDYRALRSEPRARLRYLLALLAKEIVVRSTSVEHAAVLESLVEVLAHAERNLRGV